MAGIIPQTFIDDLLERIDIVEVIDNRVKLKKAGKNYSACCPFHDEKTASFTVSPDKQFFYCFGCGASGNSLGFVMDYERVSFPEAVESLAKSVGVNVPREQTKDPQKRAKEDAQEKARKILYQLMESANTYYQEQLRIHPKKAVNYLKNRGLSGQIAKDFGIGYAPPGWDNLLKKLATSSEKQNLLLEGGMLIHNQDKDRLYDRFRERIMFPIHDTRGRVIGFGGRVLNEEKPKYLNSPETPIFHKGKELYGLYEARQAYRQLPRLVVVEGYMDVVALAQYGIRYSVATLGTACGEEHLKRAFRFTDEVVFCFDGDEAGRTAARRAMQSALPVMEDGRQVKFLYLPEGEDPDTLVRQTGADKFIRMIEEASPLEHFLFEELSQGLNTQTMEGRARLCKLAAPLLDQLPRGVYRELMFGQLSNRTQLSMDALVNLLSELPTLEKTTSEEVNTRSNNQPTTQVPIQHPSPQAAQISTSLSSNHLSVSQFFLVEERAPALLLYNPQLIEYVEDINTLSHSKNDHILTFIEIVKLIRQRPNLTSGQIVGHWQGTFGANTAKRLSQYMLKAALFHYAKNISLRDKKCAFDSVRELRDTITCLIKQQDKRSYELIIEQLKDKPSKQWSNEEKELYKKAIAARHSTSN
ncbi:DNA primase [Candidatus Endobugula sertula]|uniref:DNA primase n=1 Tax=Candidatus Endobugula sertula TaxID=62101 RepID=A0A1D2QTE2_9GAMM|nr:DNA primase [Candidatus Endobugula sertula]